MRSLASEADITLVLGSQNSSNSQRLRELAAALDECLKSDKGDCERLMALSIDAECI